MFYASVQTSACYRMVRCTGRTRALGIGAWSNLGCFLTGSSGWIYNTIDLMIEIII
jgi:hypothetical protein